MDRAWADLFSAARAEPLLRASLGDQLPKLRLLTRAGSLSLMQSPAQASQLLAAGEKCLDVLLPCPVPPSNVIHARSFSCLVSVDLKVLYRH